MSHISKSYDIITNRYNKNLKKLEEEYNSINSTINRIFTDDDSRINSYFRKNGRRDIQKKFDDISKKLLGDDVYKTKTIRNKSLKLDKIYLESEIDLHTISKLLRMDAEYHNKFELEYNKIEYKRKLIELEYEYNCDTNDLVGKSNKNEKQYKLDLLDIDKLKKELFNTLEETIDTNVSAIYRDCIYRQEDLQKNYDTKYSTKLIHSLNKETGKQETLLWNNKLVSHTYYNPMFECGYDEKEDKLIVSP